jgi:hypothetical protein
MKLLLLLMLRLMGVKRSAYRPFVETAVPLEE